MAKQTVILNVSQGIAGLTSVQCLFWLAVPVGQEQPLRGTASSSWLGASAAENSAIQQGQVIEEGYSFYFPSTLTKAQIETQVKALFDARQVGFTSAPKPGQFYGVFFDSVTGWSS